MRSRLFSQIDGPSDKPAIVFVHGLAASGAAWQSVSDRLKSRFCLVRYDLRSHGRSPATEASCDPGDLASDLFDVMDDHAIDSAIVVGHSAGGVIAMRAALDRPERVAGLVLVGTASECNDKTAAWYRDVAEVARTQGGAGVLKAMRLRPSEDPVPDGPGFAQVALAMATLNERPLTARLRDSRVRAWIVVGENDFLGVGGSVILHRALAGSVLDIVPDRGHGIYLEDPDWFSQRLAAFVDSLASD